MWLTWDFNTGLYSKATVMLACIRKHHSLDKEKCAILSVLTDLQKCNSDEITIAGFNAHNINEFMECIYTERIY